MSEQRPNGDEGNAAASEPPKEIRTKEQAQIALILEEFGDEVEVSPRGWAEVGADSIYRTGSFLIRDRDLPRVRELFRGGRTDFPSIDGLTRFQPDPKFEFPPDAPQAETLTRRYLAYVDQVLGRGVARLDHLVYACSVSPCPATEQLEVPPAVSPTPAPVGGDCDGRGVKVLVVDVGWTETDAPWLAGVTGEDEHPYSSGTNIRPYAGHGVFIAGVLRCVAPRTEIVVKAYLNRAGAAFGSDLVVKLDEGLAENPDLISLSAGAKTGDGSTLLAFDVFLERLADLKGVLLVAAAGNDGDREYFFPAASPSTLSVGALAEDLNHRASFTNYGGWVDVYAPGENLINAYLHGDFTCTEPPYRGEVRHFRGMARWSGTSFATPLVAGLVAGRMSVTGENAHQAAEALVAQARQLPGVGRTLLPEDACPQPDHACCKPHCC
ncbi:subtilase family protein [Kribbella amoyensis]|uniref:Subtilase family protein n=1 Tax=Kribbella amoyensis TaxID=996641 RepID=A0A561BJW6_9ACTN|nr:S8 family serine peptidase [Kribbella amoyensis]TWD79125.1 subtilase family protein [Kribbella amoyensis]